MNALGFQKHHGKKKLFYCPIVNFHVDMETWFDHVIGKKANSHGITCKM